MKKVVGIVLVLVMVLAFAAPAFAVSADNTEPPALADGTEPPAPADGTEPPAPADGTEPTTPQAGANGTEYEIYIPDPNDPEVLEPAIDAGQDIIIDPTAEENAAIFEEEALVSTAEDPDAIVADEAKFITSAGVGTGTYDENGYVETWDPYAGPGVFTFWDSNINSNDVVQLWQYWVDEMGGEWYNLYDAVYDETDGSWNVVVNDVGLFSYYVALIQRGIEPEVAVEMVQEEAQKSPKTADNSPSDGILWMVVLLGVAGAGISIRKMALTAK